jgi:hypothetical protein
VHAEAAANSIRFGFAAKSIAFAITLAKWARWQHCSVHPKILLSAHESPLKN